MPPPNVLLLIDDPTFRGPLLPALRAAGMGTLMTGDGEHARALIARGGISLIVVDARLPGEGGLAWVTARRAAGLAIPVILAASTKEEMRTFLDLALKLNLASVVSRAVKPEDLAHHIGELLQEFSVAPPQVSVSAEPDEQDDGGQELANELERFRQSLQRLQQDPERRERIESTLAAAESLASVAGTYSNDYATKTAKVALEILGDALNARRRMDHAAFSEIERYLARAREAGPAAVAGAARPTVAKKKTSSSSHEPQSNPGLRLADHGVDELTGLLPRDGFAHDAEELVSGAMIDGRPLAFCVLTIAGAEVLRKQGLLERVVQATGRFLGARFRPVDRRGRWGEATFALGFPATPPAMAADLVNRTLEAFKSVRVNDAAGVPITVALGAGIASYPKDAKTLDLLLSIAERASVAAATRGGGLGK